jgi:hypothetical protein
LAADRSLSIDGSHHPTISWPFQREQDAAAAIAMQAREKEKKEDKKCI